MDNALEAAAAAETAAQSAQIAADAAADAAAQPQLDPNALVAADVAIVQQKEETERAKIAARTEVTIAELQTEEPPWLSDIRECLMRLEAGMEIILSQRSSIPAQSIVIAENPEAPMVENNPPAVVEEDQREAEIENPPEAVEPAAVEQVEHVPLPQKRRWI